MEANDIKAALDAHAGKLEEAVKRYEGQLAENGKVATEAKDAVKVLSEQYADLAGSLTAMGQKLADGIKGPAPLLTAGQEFVNSEDFKALVAGRIQRARMEVKNTVTSDATTVHPAQMAGVIPGNFLPLTIRQTIPSIPVTSNAIDSLREASWTNAADEVSEGGAKSESTLTFEAYSVAIRTVAHWIKVSNALLADAPAIVAYIDRRLRDGLAQRIDLQLLKGNGTLPNLSGLTDSGNYTAYTASSGDTLTDAINRAKYQLWALGYMPDVAIVNPADWGAMERTRDGATAGTGSYLYGAPGMAAGVNPFGVRIVLSNNMTAGEFLVGALNRATVLYTRQGATVEMGYINEDFTNNLVTIRAEERLGLGVEVPSAILYGEFIAT